MKDQRGTILSQNGSDDYEVDDYDDYDDDGDDDDYDATQDTFVIVF